MNSFGRIFRISIFGESHGQTMGVVIDGCPAGIPFSEDTMKDDLSRRKAGAEGTTSRKEKDLPKISSGCFNDHTTGAPIMISFENDNVRSEDYKEFKDIPRPGHADFTANKKFNGFNDPRGGGHFSGRLTLGLVAAGSLAKKLIGDIKIHAQLLEAGGDYDIQRAVGKAKENKDSVGGIIQCSISNVPVGLGEPFFDSMESLISHLVFSIPGVKGIEFGSGFYGAYMHGSEHNDPFIDVNGKTQTNHAGGINGGISNGNEIVFRVAVKPTSSVGAVQKTMNFKTGEIESLEIKGRHDACIALRMPVIIEASAAIVLADLMMLTQ